MYYQHNVPKGAAAKSRGDEQPPQPLQPQLPLVLPPLSHPSLPLFNPAASSPLPLLEPPTKTFHYHYYQPPQQQQQLHHPHFQQPLHSYHQLPLPQQQQQHHLAAPHFSSHHLFPPQLQSLLFQPYLTSPTIVSAPAILPTTFSNGALPATAALTVPTTTALPAATPLLCSQPSPLEATSSPAKTTPEIGSPDNIKKDDNNKPDAPSKDINNKETKNTTNPTAIPITTTTAAVAAPGTYIVVRCSACLGEEQVEESHVIDEGWICSECRHFSDDYFKGTIAIPSMFRADQKVECLLSVRVGGGVGVGNNANNANNNNGEVEYLAKWKNCDWQSNSWVTQKQLRASRQEECLLQFLQSIVFRNLVQAALKDPEFQLCNVLPELCAMANNKSNGINGSDGNGHHDGGDDDGCGDSSSSMWSSSSPVQKIVYRCLNGKPFGVTQYLNVFTEEELQYFEKCCDSMEENEKYMMENTIDKTKDHSRTKYFVGYRYDYATRKQPFLHDDVDKLDTPATNWMTELIQLLEKRGIVPQDFLNCAVLNVYHRAGAGLGVHMDSISLFHRPIFSVRFFSKSVLSFGCRGPGMTDRKVAVPQPRGCITVLEGFAANCTTHCIRPADVRKKTASIILRKVKPEMLVTKQPDEEEQQESSSIRSRDTPKRSPQSNSTPRKSLRSSTKRSPESSSSSASVKQKTRAMKRREQQQEEEEDDNDSPSASPSPPSSPRYSASSTSSSPSPHHSAPTTSTTEANPSGRPRREKKINVSLVNFPYIQW
eukprot:TRINITY_DN3246_c0_g1_i2.p2 TRINITY_DN3246_c0_g1~~TRINITY_DN3246_c0_g1_i2.p2  ORF type:complete len:769 (-),score=235.82 TRINITY_DN3246_c0_g1_i2:104-2410(-)